MTTAETAARFAKAEIATRPELPTLDTLPVDLWRGMGEAGLLALGIPREQGGLGLDRRAQIATAEALVRHGRTLGVASCFQLHNTLARFAIAGFGTAEQKAEILPAMAAGRRTFAMAISELGAGAHPKKLTTTARREGDRWILDGEKAYLTNGPMADGFLVMAITAVENGRKRYSSIIVPRDSAGLTVTPATYIDYLRPCGHCGIRLQGVSVPAANLLGPEGRGYELIAQPFRNVEDINKLGSLAGGMLAEIDMLAESGAVRTDDARADLGGLLAQVAAFKVLTAAILDSDDAGRSDDTDTLLLASRAAARRFHADYTALRASLQIEAPQLDRFARDMGQSGGVAKYVEQIRLHRLADQVLTAAA
jgi:acyl-CoA dehydrogenase